MSLESTSDEELKELIQSLSSELPVDEQRIFQCFEILYKRHESDVTILDAFGEFLINATETLTNGDMEKLVHFNELGNQLLAKSIEISPENGSMKYFYLGQRCQDGDTALSLLSTGARIALQELSAIPADDTPSLMAQKQRLTDFWISLIEIYMTSLCHLDEAEDKCRELIEQSVDLCPTNFNVWATSAMFKKTVGEIEDAKNDAKKALKLINIKDDECKDDVESDCENDEIEPVEAEALVNFSRTLIDLEMTNEACEILTNVICENERDVSAEYSLACCFLVVKDFDAARESIERARKICQEDQFDEMLQQLDLLQKQITS